MSLEEPLEKDLQRERDGKRRAQEKFVCSFSSGVFLLPRAPPSFAMHTFAFPQPPFKAAWLNFSSLWDNAAHTVWCVGLVHSVPRGKVKEWGGGERRVRAEEKASVGGKLPSTPTAHGLALAETILP